MLKSYISPKIKIKESNIHGNAMFAVTPIVRDEIVFVKGGHILTREQFFSSGIINSYLPISDNLFLGATNKSEEESIKLYLNHSCESNCGMKGEIIFVAMRDIKPDEELTLDYAMIDNEDYVINCTCKTQSCRHKVTGFDWKLPMLQNKYGKYFALYLREKFENA